MLCNCPINADNPRVVHHVGCARYSLCTCKVDASFPLATVHDVGCPRYGEDSYPRLIYSKPDVPPSVPSDFDELHKELRTFSAVTLGLAMGAACALVLLAIIEAVRMVYL